MADTQRLTLENCTSLLQRCGYISSSQAVEVISGGKQQQARLSTPHTPGAPRRLLVGAEAVSPAEVIASFNLERCDRPGIYLTEDMITEALAAANVSTT